MKITIVLPDGTRQPIEVPEQATLRRLLPAFAEKVKLPRRDESGTAVAYYATHHKASELTGETDLSTLADHDPIPDDQSLTGLGIRDNDLLLLHPVVVTDPAEVIEPEADAAPEESIRRQRERPSGLPRVARIGCFIAMMAFCCIPVTLFSWLAYAIGQEVQSQLATPAPFSPNGAPSSPDGATAEVVTFNGHDWDFVVADAEYNPVSERLIVISSNPHHLHIYDPNNGQDIQIPLSQEPTAVSVNPDGRSAIVGHDGLLSLINLETQIVSQTASIEANIFDIVLAGNGWAYATASANNKDSIYGMEIEPESETVMVLPHNNESRLLQLAPDGRSLYATTSGPEPGRLEKIDIVQGAPSFLYDSEGAIDTCGEVWLAENGRFAFSGCGHIWGLADRKQDDMVLRGNLFETTTQIRALTYSAVAGRILLISESADQQVQIFDDVQFELLGTEILPEGTHGRFIFTNIAGSQYYVIIQTDDRQYGLVTGDL